MPQLEKGNLVTPNYFINADRRVFGVDGIDLDNRTNFIEVMGLRGLQIGPVPTGAALDDLIASGSHLITTDAALTLLYSPQEIQWDINFRLSFPFVSIPLVPISAKFPAGSLSFNPPAVVAPNFLGLFKTETVETLPEPTDLISASGRDFPTKNFDLNQTTFFDEGFSTGLLEDGKLDLQFSSLTYIFGGEPEIVLGLTRGTSIQVTADLSISRTVDPNVCILNTSASVSGFWGISDDLGNSFEGGSQTINSVTAVSGLLNLGEFTVRQIAAGVAARRRLGPVAGGDPRTTLAGTLNYTGLNSRGRGTSFW